MPNFSVSIHNFLVRILSGFIINKDIRKKFREFFLYSAPETNINIKDLGKNNIIKLPKNIEKTPIKGSINITVDGDNNIVDLSEIVHRTGAISIYLYGDNQNISFGRTFVNNSLSIVSGQHVGKYEKANNVNIKFGNLVFIEEMKIITLNSNVNIEIGNNCMISYGVTLYHTDAHPIYDINTNKIINFPKDMKIGDNCWLGANTTILKNVQLPKGTIVGYGAVVGGGVWTRENTAIAGNPARVVKENIRYELFDPEYIKNERKDSVITN